MRRYGILLLVAVLFTAALARDALDGWIAATDLPSHIVDTSTEVRDRDGVLLRAYMVADGRWRLGARPDQVDPLYISMLLAYEDKRFRDHNGVDLRAMLRAGAQAAISGRIVSGASTLSMQVARLLEEGSTGKWTGKLRQIRVALALERRMDKAQILTLYLTLAPYGGNLEGVRAATLAWFGKEPTRLTPAQAALLVALPQSPEARRPDENPAAARVARDRVLARMVQAGVLTAEAHQAALRAPVPSARRAFPALAPHMADRAVADAPDARRHDLTLRAPVQRRFERLAGQVLQGKSRHLSIAIVAADHRDGEILASVGSGGYRAGPREGYVDMTRALRSPGSTLKPLVYALSFDQGLAHPETLIDDTPVDFGGYAPQNFDGEFRGRLRVSDALRLSLNIPAVRLTRALGPARLMAGLRRAGADPQLPGGRAGLAVALGGVGLRLEGLVQLYAGLANGGRVVDLRWRRGARDNEQAQRLVGPAAAWHVGHILSRLSPPPGARAWPMAYKTGTSYGHRDAWAVGYDGAHVVGVWIGRPDGTPVPGAFGGDLAAPVLFAAFERLGGAPVPLPSPPPGALMVPNAGLPAPLQVFRPRGPEARRAARGHAPRLAFPPDGARLPVRQEGLTAKVRAGVPPFSWLANGRPVVTGARRREVTLPDPGRGFLTLTVIDAEGRADRAQLRLD
ncbi:MAG: penicillin-binding protein 1C [Sediminimonas sp.]|uniref:penicillin-binding protein 1C n=1 Tax=Sediminimonas sp. TaxID=2823379 RepID=UPI00286FD0FB|nr:penicillin-binding protein 1C [Sediminimonas sp.]MDR9485895.1 penicillin-binding protein 1C [Sediminimonas sp.]